MKHSLLSVLLITGLSIAPLNAEPEKIQTKQVWTEKQLQAFVNFLIASGIKLKPHALNALLASKDFAIANPYTTTLLGGVSLSTLAYKNRKYITNNVDLKDFAKKHWHITYELPFVAGSIWGSGKMATHLISELSQNSRDFRSAWPWAFSALLGITAAPVSYGALQRLYHNAPTKPVNNMVQVVTPQNNKTVGEPNEEVAAFVNLIENNEAPPLLFDGKTGTGKTTTAMLIAKKLNKTLYIVDASSFSSVFINGVASNIKKVIEHLEKTMNAGDILLTDEFEVLAGSREGSNSQSNSEKMATIAYMNLLNRLQEKGIMIIGATNNKAYLDTAAIRRFKGNEFTFTCPAHKQRMSTIKTSLKKHGSKIDISEINKLSRYIADKIPHMPAHTIETLCTDIIKNHSVGNLPCNINLVASKEIVDEAILKHQNNQIIELKKEEDSAAEKFDKQESILREKKNKAVQESVKTRDTINTIINQLINLDILKKTDKDTVTILNKKLEELRKKGLHGMEAQEQIIENYIANYLDLIENKTDNKEWLKLEKKRLQRILQARKTGTAEKTKKLITQKNTIISQRYIYAIAQELKAYKNNTSPQQLDKISQLLKERYEKESKQFLTFNDLFKKQYEAKKDKKNDGDAEWLEANKDNIECYLRNKNKIEKLKTHYKSLENNKTNIKNLQEQFAPIIKEQKKHDTQQHKSDILVHETSQEYRNLQQPWHKYFTGSEKYVPNLEEEDVLKMGDTITPDNLYKKVQKTEAERRKNIDFYKEPSLVESVVGYFSSWFTETPEAKDDAQQYVSKGVYDFTTKKETDDHKNNQSFNTSTDKEHNLTKLLRNLSNSENLTEQDYRYETKQILEDLKTTKPEEIATKQNEKITSVTQFLKTLSALRGRAQLLEQKDLSSFAQWLITPQKASTEDRKAFRKLILDNLKNEDTLKGLNEVQPLFDEQINKKQFDIFDKRQKELNYINSPYTIIKFDEYKTKPINFHEQKMNWVKQEKRQLNMYWTKHKTQALKLK